MGLEVALAAVDPAEPLLHWPAMLCLCYGLLLVACLTLQGHTCHPKHQVRHSGMHKRSCSEQGIPGWKLFIASQPGLGWKDGLESANGRKSVGPETGRAWRVKTVQVSQLELQRCQSTLFEKLIPDIRANSHISTQDGGSCHWCTAEMHRVLSVKREHMKRLSNSKRHKVKGCFPLETMYQDQKVQGHLQDIGTNRTYSWRCT